MKAMLRIEMKRAIINKKLLIALLFGSIISFYQLYLYQKVGNTNEMYDMAVAYGKDTMTLPDYLWGAWLGGDTMLFNGFLFFLIIPLLAAFPYANSYMLDEKDGYLTSVFTRTNKKYYFISKWLATFCSGGVAIVLPLALNFLMMSTRYSSMGPFTESSQSMVVEASTMSGLFFRSPFIYIIVFHSIIFIFSGLYATCSLLVAFFTDYSFIILAFPFLIIIFLSTVLEFFGLSYLSPQEFLFPAQAKTSMALILGEMLFLFLISFVSYIFYGVRGAYE
ncbi:hypothetical protein [uncultured Vagococcus sp.]|uniref:hypothetical protein n=1 Tax=uncultured Vagococcus sp. TaxID=189676 RepID=UPI0028D08B3D|nr:hypothetical protein [uncultured Vagococcus sp.]